MKYFASIIIIIATFAHQFAINQCYVGLVKYVCHCFYLAFLFVSGFERDSKSCSVV